MSENMRIAAEDLIEEVRQRPGIYDLSRPLDRDEKLILWKEVGAALYDDWNTLSKSNTYERVLHLQKKWRSLRDAYSRELRWRKQGVKTSKRVYLYFKRLKFLGGMDEETEQMMNSIQNPDNHSAGEDETSIQGVSEPEKSCSENDFVQKRTSLPKRKHKVQKVKKRKIKPKIEEESDYEDHMQTEEIEIPAFVEADDDSDRLFLMSFLPEMRKLQPNIKMWMRAQIASIMQEAVTCQYNNSQPGASGYEGPSNIDTKGHLTSSD